MINNTNYDIDTSIECKVKAKLTEYGARINALLATPYVVDNEGCIETTLWNLMKDFGRYIIRTSFHIANQPFEDNRIKIINDGKYVKETKKENKTKGSWKNII